VRPHSHFPPPLNHRQGGHCPTATPCITTVVDTARLGHYFLSPCPAAALVIVTPTTTTPVITAPPPCRRWGRGTGTRWRPASTTRRWGSAFLARTLVALGSTGGSWAWGPRARYTAASPRRECSPTRSPRGRVAGRHACFGWVRGSQLGTLGFSFGSSVFDSQCKPQGSMSMAHGSTFRASDVRVSFTRLSFGCIFWVYALWLYRSCVMGNTVSWVLGVCVTGCGLWCKVRVARPGWTGVGGASGGSGVGGN